MARSFKIESTVRGHHVFKNIWTPTIGEDLRVTAETDNTFDEFAVAVCKDNIKSVLVFPTEEKQSDGVQSHRE